MVVMLVVLVALGTIAGLTVISVQGGSSTTSAQRFSAMALYAAESGAAATMDWLKTQYRVERFTGLVSAQNNAPLSPTEIPGNGVQPGASGNLLSADQQGWYEVTILNNRSDTGFVDGKDDDGILLLQVTGHGPNGAMKRIEWEVQKHDPEPPDVGATSDLVLRGWRDLF